MDFDEGNYKIWKISIYWLWLVTKDIMYEDLIKRPKMKDYGQF